MAGNGENLAGVRRGDVNRRAHYTQGNKDHFTHDVDPYVTPGEPDSGLLPYVFEIDNLTNGQGDKKIQAYNYRVCLTTDPKLRIPTERPQGYREIDHELLLRNFEAGDHRVPALIEPLDGNGAKVDWNHMNAIGSDYYAKGRVRESHCPHLPLGLARGARFDPHGAGIHGARTECGDGSRCGAGQWCSRAGRRLRDTT